MQRTVVAQVQWERMAPPADACRKGMAVYFRAAAAILRDRGAAQAWVMLWGGGSKMECDLRIADRKAGSWKI